MIGDTIWAVASPPGGASRGVIRISGPEAFAAAEAVVVEPVPRARGAHELGVVVLGRRIDALVLTMPGPRSYTGEDVVELHLPGSPLLLERVGAACGVRRALPGEFTRRAFENRRISLDQAEAVLALIHAADLGAARRAAVALGGGLRPAIAVVRGLVDEVRAWLEAGLDFTADETGAVEAEIWLPLARDAGRRLDALLDELPVARPGGDLVLLGAANAGKSSLCNALAGRDVVIVSDQPGTTRDLIAVEIAPGVRLLDAPGDVDGAAGADAAALRHRDAGAGSATAAILVVDPRLPRLADPRGLGVVAVVLTHADAGAGALPEGLPAGVPVFRVGSPARIGIDDLRRFLLERAAPGPDVGGSATRESVEAARDALERAITAGVIGDAAELAAFELQEAIAALDRIDGSSCPEDLLDRVFARFCLGK